MKDNSSLLSKIVFGLFSFACPLLGIILFFVWKNKKQKLAICVIICSILGIVFGAIGYRVYLYSIMQSLT